MHFDDPDALNGMLNRWRSSEVTHGLNDTLAHLLFQAEANNRIAERLPFNTHAFALHPARAKLLRNLEPTHYSDALRPTHGR